MTPDKKVRRQTDTFEWTDKKETVCWKPHLRDTHVVWVVTKDSGMKMSYVPRPTIIIGIPIRKWSHKFRILEKISPIRKYHFHQEIKVGSTLWETAPPAPFFIGCCWAKPTWMGGVVLLPLKIEVRLVIFFPLD